METLEHSPLAGCFLDTESYFLEPPFDETYVKQDDSVHTYTYLPTFSPFSQGVETPSCTAGHQPGDSGGSDIIQKKVKRMSQYRILQFLRFLDAFTTDFVSRANELPKYRNNPIFKRLQKDLFVSLKRHFCYRMAPNPYSSDAVFTAFFLFNVLLQQARNSDWNPITFPDHLIQLFGDRNAMKKLTLICVKQYRQPNSGTNGTAHSTNTNAANRYYLCLQPFFNDDSLIVTMVHEIRDRLSAAIQAVSRYIEQRKEAQQTRPPRERVKRKKKTPSSTSATLAEAHDANISSHVSPDSRNETDSSDMFQVADDAVATPESCAPGSGFFCLPKEDAESGGIFNTSVDQITMWLDNYIQHTNSGFYMDDLFTDNLSLTPIN